MRGARNFKVGQYTTASCRIKKGIYCYAKRDLGKFTGQRVLVVGDDQRARFLAVERLLVVDSILSLRLTKKPQQVWL